LPLKPCKAALDDPASRIPTESTTVLRLALLAGPAQPDPVDAPRLHHLVALVAGVRLIADQDFRRRLDQAAVEGQRRERELTVVHSARGHCYRQAVASDDRREFGAFATSRRSGLVAATLRRGNRGVVLASRLHLVVNDG
jgi:hypothetical protein